MFCGLDFGTSNSALGVYTNDQPCLLPLFKGEKYFPSTLYSFDRSLIAEFIYQHISPSQKDLFKVQRSTQLQRAASFRRHEGYALEEPCNYFGKQAIEHYIDTPEEGIFIKSPKSFLGSTGLSEQQIFFFEDLVTAMMLNIKLIAEEQIEDPLTKVVIGRPVNFQGVNSEKSNQQAIKIMTSAAQRCGYKEIEFLYEPLAAGIDFETNLTEDKIVLVVDIGGGTTDCSMVKMGPSFVNKEERSSDFLAHTGERIGGNDLDILLAYHGIMPLFGRGSLQKKGIQAPDGIFWSSVSINNVAEQTMFSSRAFYNRLKSLRREMQQPQLLERLIKLQSHKLNHRLVRNAELAKIDLSDNQQVTINLDYVEELLSTDIKQQQFESAVEKPLNRMTKLIQEAVKLSATKPDNIYITGGSAKSPTVRKVIENILPGIAILDGDYYGSVASGLTKWANKVWR